MSIIRPRRVLIAAVIIAVAVIAASIRPAAARSTGSIPAGLRMLGSDNAQTLDAALTDMASPWDGSGYWLYGTGDPPFRRSVSGVTASQPAVVVTAAPSGTPYHLVSQHSSASPAGQVTTGVRVSSVSRSGGSTNTTTNTTTVTTVQSVPSGPTFQDGFASLPLGLGWADGSTHGSWFDQFNGYGTSGIVSDGGNALALIPKASTSTSETHSALVTSLPSFGDLDVTYQYRTVSQLRTGSAPNSWEVGWALWHLTDYQHFYYVLLKPTGWELGKEDPAYPGSQRFLATGSSPTFAVGAWHQIRVVQVGSSISVWADGSPLVSFTDTERPYLTGSLGLYCEDSEVHFLRVVVK